MSSVTKNRYNPDDERPTIIAKNIPKSILRISAVACIVLCAIALHQFHGEFHADFQALLNKNITWQQATVLFGSTLGIPVAITILAQQIFVKRASFHQGKPKEKLSDGERFCHFVEGNYKQLLEDPDHSIKYRDQEYTLESARVAVKNAPESVQKERAKRLLGMDSYTLTVAKTEESPLGSRTVVDDEGNTQRIAPIDDNGLWKYMENEADHAKEAGKIGAETQAIGLGRFFFPFIGRLQYVTSKELKEECYDLKPMEPRVEEGHKAHNVGHATLAYQCDGLNIMTDPTSRALAGADLIYTREVESDGRPRDWTPPDVILISHDHYDHMDKAALRQLSKFKPHLIVPKGTNLEVIKKLGYKAEQIHEVTWWETTTITMKNDNGTEKTFKFFSLPSYHWSGRAPGSGCGAHESQTLSFAFTSVGSKEVTYFGGDSAKMEGFVLKAIAEFLEWQLGKGAVTRFNNWQPAGPNTRHSLMRSTHKSAIHSLYTQVQFMKYLGLDMHQIKTFFMHQNAYELGNDRYNECVAVLDQMTLKAELRSSKYYFITELEELVSKHEWTQMIEIYNTYLTIPKTGQNFNQRA